ncbi:MAG: phospholipid carrier-dependent glycosyltransferase [Anaerolineae bacterium]|nr:phospholipid carrier-dependent glycosyltransferase [Anaerolineae bacterium]
MKIDAEVRKPLATALILAILLFGSALRMVALDETPPGFYVDEAIESYDAYSIWQTGRDHHGAFLPLAPGGVNDYRMPLFIYSMAPIVGLAGLSVTAARLAVAFWSILGIAAVYALGVRVAGRTAGLVAALCLAISPWHVPFGRFTHEGSAAVFLSTLAVGMLWQWRKCRRRFWIIGAAVASALGIYTYSITKFFMPFMLLSLAIVWWRELWAQWRQVAVAALVGLALAAPMLYLNVRDYDKMQARYRAVAVFQPERPLLEAGAEAFQNALDNLSLDFLFVRGDQDEIYHPKGNGQLYLAQAGLILIGAVWGLARRETRSSTVLLGVWILLGVLPAALTIHRPGSGSGNASRALIAVVPWQLLTGMGVLALAKLVPSRRVLWGIGLILSLWLGYAAWSYFGYYFGDYAADAYRHFDGEMGAIMAQVAPLAGEYDAVYLTCHAGDFPYTQILFYTRYDPRLLQADLPERGEGLFAPVWRVGKYNITCDTADLWNQGLPGLYVVPEEELPDVPPLALIPVQPGRRGYKLVARPTFEYNFSALAWLGQCSQPVAPLNATLLARNAPAARAFEFNCDSSWVYPAGDASGAYVLYTPLALGIPVPDQGRTAPDLFIRRRLGDAAPGFIMAESTRAFPEFIVYDRIAAPDRPAPVRGIALPAGASPDIALAAPLSTSVALQGPLSFLGATRYPGVAGWELETWWEVSAAAPVTRSISLMAHRLAPDGEVLEIADGFGAVPATLRRGDVVLQRHRFTGELPVDGWLRLGGYWLDTMARWPVAGVPEADAIFVLIEE